MGLAISVGNPCIGYDDEGEEHFRRSFEAMRRALAECGVTGWSEPERRPPAGAMRKHVSSLPYSHLHHLRRAYALMAEYQPVTPVTGKHDLDSARRYVEDASSMLTSHLLCHADYGGYYVPARFPEEDPLFLADDLAGGGIVGSSSGLLRDLRAVAPVIGVALEADGRLADAEAARLFGGNTGDPFEIEQVVWLALHEASRASIEHGNVVVFH